MKKQKKGMTLVEVIVAMAIFAIIVVMVFPALAILNLNNNASQEVFEATYYTQLVAEEINEVSAQNSSNQLMIEEYLLVEKSFVETPADSNVYVKELANAPFIMTVEILPVDGSSNLKHLIIEASPKNNSTTDRSKLEMVVRLSGN